MVESEKVNNNYTNYLWDKQRLFDVCVMRKMLL